MALRRLLLIRHGETTSDPAVRFLGSTDTPLTDRGRSQMHRAAGRIGQRPVDAFLATSLKRSWQGATILSGGGNVRLLADLEEIGFGRWEGRTLEEVGASDPVLYQDWQAGAPTFEFPNGETRGDFSARIRGALESIEASGAREIVAVLDAGVIAELAHRLTGASLEEGVPGLGESIVLTRTHTGWILGAHSSDPAGLENAAA